MALAVQIWFLSASLPNYKSEIYDSDLIIIKIVMLTSIILQFLVTLNIFSYSI